MSLGAEGDSSGPSRLLTAVSILDVLQKHKEDFDSSLSPILAHLICISSSLIDCIYIVFFLLNRFVKISSVLTPLV